MIRRVVHLVVCVGLALALATAVSSRVEAESPPEAGVDAAAPALVVLLAVDQLRRDRLDATLPGGLGRLAREGRVHTEGLLDHSATETCPGHASMLSGRHPGPSGIPGNSYIDRANGERRYCVADPAEDAAVLGGDPNAEYGRSPRNLRVDVLGDWMKRADPETRVFSVSAKDRAAITLGGQRPDGVYWLVRGPDPRFTTSRYYRESLPPWVDAWNGVGLAARVPETWTHSSEPHPDSPLRIDDFEGESDERSRTTPHPLHGDDAEELAENLYRSPFLDQITLDFALTLVDAEKLGARGRPDLLAISLSATDTVGHGYGPESLESRDALMRLDAWLGDFLAALESRLGPGRVVLALTADHGVLPLPEWLEATGKLECPLEGGRQGLVSLVLGLYAELHLELSPFSWPSAWVNAASQLTIDRELARDREVPLDEAIAVAERWLEAQPSIREAWTAKEIHSRDSEIARLYRNSFDPERSGDLALEFEETCLPDFYGSGTSHGTPHAYDRAVPIVFWGAGVPGGQVSGPAYTVDIAPTLAGRIGLTPPDDLSGRNLLPKSD